MRVSPTQDQIEVRRLQAYTCISSIHKWRRSCNLPLRLRRYYPCHRYRLAVVVFLPSLLRRRRIWPNTATSNCFRSRASKNWRSSGIGPKALHYQCPRLMYPCLRLTAANPVSPRAHPLRRRPPCCCYQTGPDLVECPIRHRTVICLTRLAHHCPLLPLLPTWIPTMLPLRLLPTPLGPSI